MDSENIKKAFDLFVDDKYTEAKEIIKVEITNAKDEFLNKKLGIKNKSETNND